MLAITRKLDKLGRVVIPKEIRDALSLKTNDKLLVRLEGKQIFIDLSTKGGADNAD